MEPLTTYLTQFGRLTLQEIDLIASQVSERRLAKEALFSEAGKVPRQVGFVLEGVMRGYYYRNGEEITRCFIPENNLVVDYLNFEEQTASTEYLQACTDCRIIVFSKSVWDGLSAQISLWDHMKSKMVQTCLYLKSRKHPVISQDATTRYIEFLESYPSLVNRVPLAHVASYIGVTQQSLSRIRRNLLSNRFLPNGK